MSWFSREWDGVHREGCPCYNEWDDIEVCTCGDPVDVHYRNPHGSYYARLGCAHCQCKRFMLDCKCPEIMVDDAVSAAEARYDSMMNR